MKLLCTLLLLVAAASGWAQEIVIPPAPPVDARTNLITYSEVVPAPGATQATLLARARVWANRVSVLVKPPLLVNELGTDVVVVAVSQQLPLDKTLTTIRLYFLAKLCLREGRYQYHFDEFTYESNGVNGTYTNAAELDLLSTPTTKNDQRTQTKLRTQFEQAMGQAGATLREAMLTPLVPPDTNGTEW